jgi:integrase
VAKDDRGWEGAPNYRWVRMIDGVRYRVTCKALGLPESQWTKAGSRAAANAHFEQLGEKRVLDKYAAHPELALHKQALEAAKAVGQETEVGELTAYMDEVAARPSGATTDSPILLQKRRSLEELLEVDLAHVPLGIIEELTIKRDVRLKLRERLRGKEAADPDRTVGHLVAVYLAQRQQSEAKQLKATATVEFDRYNLRRMTEFMTSGLAVDDIGYDLWHRWGEHCQSMAETGGWAEKTAKSTLTGSKSWMRWLYSSGRIEKLPRNFDDYKVTVTLTEPETFTPAELKRIYGAADDETRLLMLLALNTGANQIDIANLEYARSEKTLGLWLGTGSVRRKRVKTRKVKRVPVVRYVLWPETLELLERFRQQTGAVVLRNTTGGLWVSRVRGEDGKYKNNDAVGLRFNRLLEEIGIKDKGKSFKTLRATSASLLGNSDKYRPYGPLFLGHAPDGVFEGHYLQEDCRVLNEGVGWLRQKVLAYLQ